MKNWLLYLGFIVYVLGAGSCSTKKQLLGTWRIETKGDSEGTEYVFQRNGTLEKHISGQDIEINNWEYSKKNKAITISKNNNPESELFVINYLDPLFLGLSNKENGILLSRQLKIKSLNHRAARKKLKGEWSLVQLEDSTFVVGEQNLRMIFRDNGVYQQSIGDDSRMGRWILAEDNSTVTLSTDEKTQTLGVNFLQKRKLKLTDDYGSYLMDKTDRIPKSPSNKKIAKQIVGAWALENVGEKQVEESDCTIYLNEDRSLKVFENQHITQDGQWFVSEDGAFLVFDHSAGRKSYPIEKISHKKMKLLDDFQSIGFRRVKE